MANRKYWSLFKQQSLRSASVISLLFLLSCHQQGSPPTVEEDTVVRIGMQEWAAKNLDAVVFRNGDTIPEAKTDEEWRRAANEGTPAWCYYDNNPENVGQYGKLYNWYAVTDPRNLCPEGWHIPSKEEWEDMITELGDQAGSKLKSDYGWANDGNGTDSIRFAALPAGIRYHSGMFDDVGTNAYFWTASHQERGWFGTQGAAGKSLSYRRSTIGSNDVVGFRKGSGMSVRCVKRIVFDDYVIKPIGTPNEGLMFVDHESTGRSGHVGNAIVECGNGDILAFYVNSSGIIWGGHGAAGWTEYKRSADGGNTWSEPEIFEYSKQVWDGNENVIEDFSFNDYHTAYVTAVVAAPNGNLIAFISRRLPILPPEKQQKPVYLISYDQGYTWSTPRLIDEAASFEELTLLHSDGATFVHEENIYAVFIGGGSSDYNEGIYSFYVSNNNGESFERLSENLFGDTSSGKHMSALALEDGRFIVYSFDPHDEHQIPYVMSTDSGRTWSEVTYSYLEKRIRNAQISEKLGDYYYMTGRSGNFGDDPSCLVLYASKDGINWDGGKFLNKVQIGLDSYTANQVVGKNRSNSSERLLIQSSIGYSGLSTNVVHWWIEEHPDGD